MTQPPPKFGLEPVPRDVDQVLARLDTVSPKTSYTVASLPLPDSPLAKSVHEYAKQQLSLETYRHSMRVYYIGMAVLLGYFADAWPSLAADPTTYFLSTLLHDIGTTDQNIGATRMSFEYYGGFIARDFILKHAVGHTDAEGIADSVCETIIRHQDVGKRGFVSANTQLIQIATLFDNMGGHQQLLSNQTFKDIYEHYPRGPWSSCFANVIHKECELKPYASTTRLGEQAFSDGVLANPLNQMEK